MNPVVVKVFGVEHIHVLVNAHNRDIGRWDIANIVRYGQAHKFVRTAFLFFVCIVDKRKLHGIVSEGRCEHIAEHILDVKDIER